MPFSFIIPAVASIGSALIGSNAAQDAANTQAQGQQAALAQQQAMFNQQQQNQQPYLNAGYTALNTLGTGTTGGINQGQFTTAPSTYNPMATQQFSTLKPFTSQDLYSNLAPNYQFMLNQGLGATGMGANVSSPGSNVDRANQIFAENYAGNAYQNALNNYLTQQQVGFGQQQTQQQNTIQNALAQQQQAYNQQTGNQSNIFNRLAALAGIGQSSANVGTQATTNAMGTLGNTLGNISTAQAAGQIGSANALAGGLGSAGNYALLSSLLGPQGGANAGNTGTGYFGGIGSPQTTSTNPYSLLG